MKKLLKIYECQSDMDYFQMIADSFTNGQMSQGKEQFKQMPKNYKVQMLKAATVGNWQSGMSNANISTIFDSL